MIEYLKNRLFRFCAPMKRNECVWFTVVSIFAFIALLNIVVYSLSAANTIVSRDQWHFLPMVRDFFEGRYDFMTFWGTNSENRLPAYKLFFLIDAVILRLNMRGEIAVGLCALIVVVLLLMSRYRSGFANRSSYAALYLGLLAIAIAGLNLNQWDGLIYSLVSLAGYTGMLCTVLVWLMFDTQVRNGVSLVRTTSVFMFLAFSLLFFSSGTGPALVATLVIVLLVSIIVQWRADRNILILLGCLVLCSIVCELVYWESPGIAVSKPGSNQSLFEFLRHPIEAMQYLLLAFARSVTWVNGFYLNMTIGAGILFLYIFSVYTYIRLRMWSVTYMPAFLITYSVLFIFSTLVYRFPTFGVSVAGAPRYVPYSQLGYLGCIWIVFYWLSTRVTNVKGRHTHFDLLVHPATFFGLVAVIYCLGLVSVWRIYPYQVHSNREAVRQILDGSFNGRNWYCPSVQLCSDGREILKRYNLNVFATHSDAPPNSNDIEQSD